MHIYAFIYLYIDVNLSVDIVNTYKPKYIHIYREIHVSIYLSIYIYEKKCNNRYNDIETYPKHVDFLFCEVCWDASESEIILKTQS